MSLLRVAIALLLTFSLVGSTLAQAPSILEEAQRALGSGNHARAAQLASHAAQNPSAPRQDRAEAQRVLGLARFFLGDRSGAKAAFVDFVRLDPEAHLDPALVAPEVIILLEEVRAERAAELAAARPKPRRKRGLNLIPPLGQFQNQQRAKGWIIGGVWTSFLVANLASWAVLKSWCQDDGTCPGHHRRAEQLRTVNLVAGAGFGAAYLYGVVDGYVVMRQRSADDPAVSLGLSASESGLTVLLSGSL